jgi:hypothetical protein
LICCNRDEQNSRQKQTNLISSIFPAQGFRPFQAYGQQYTIPTFHGRLHHQLSGSSLAPGQVKWDWLVAQILIWEIWPAALDRYFTEMLIGNSLDGFLCMKFTTAVKLVEQMKHTPGTLSPWRDMSCTRIFGAVIA